MIIRLHPQLAGSCSVLQMHHMCTQHYSDEESSNSCQCDRVADVGSSIDSRFWNITSVRCDFGEPPEVNSEIQTVFDEIQMLENAIHMTIQCPFPPLTAPSRRSQTENSNKIQLNSKLSLNSVHTINYIQIPQLTRNSRFW